MTERHRGDENGDGHHTYRGRMAAAGAGAGRGGNGTRSRPTSVQSMMAPSMLTMERTAQHHQGALRAAEVSARVRVHFYLPHSRLFRPNFHRLITTYRISDSCYWALMISTILAPRSQHHLPRGITGCLLIRRVPKKRGHFCSGGRCTDGCSMCDSVVAYRLSWGLEGRERLNGVEDCFVILLDCLRPLSSLNLCGYDVVGLCGSHCFGSIVCCACSGLLVHYTVIPILLLIINNYISIPTINLKSLESYVDGPTTMM